MAYQHKRAAAAVIELTKALNLDFDDVLAGLEEVALIPMTDTQIIQDFIEELEDDSQT